MKFDRRFTIKETFNDSYNSKIVVLSIKNHSKKVEWTTAEIYEDNSSSSSYWNDNPLCLFFGAESS